MRVPRLLKLTALSAACAALCLSALAAQNPAPKAAPAPPARTGHGLPERPLHLPPTAPRRLLA